MIWAALLIGATVLLAVAMVRSRPNESALDDPRRWLVLPDAPILALPAPVRPNLPVVAVTYPSWSGADQSWRAEKPMRPWLQGAAPYAVAAALGVVSLDLTAVGLGVPEIMPTHLPMFEQGHDQRHGHDAPGFATHDLGLMSAPLAGLYEHDLGLAVQAAFAPSDSIVPSWEAPPSHDWWA